MAQTLLAEKVTLYDLKKYFGLQRVTDAKFFPEWQTVLPELAPSAKEQLDRVKANFLHLSQRPMLEEMVKMVVVSPLLDLAGFYQPPFFSTSEKAVKLSAKDEHITVKGKIDVLVFQEQFWVLVIESERSSFSLEPGIPQALAYMLATPNPAQSLYSMVTNGSSFVFLKLTQQPNPRYAQSKPFDLEDGEDLYRVLQVLKRLAEVVSQ
jgi:hypothetical protein